MCCKQWPGLVRYCIEMIKLSVVSGVYIKSGCTLKCHIIKRYFEELFLKVEAVNVVSGSAVKISHIGRKRLRELKSVNRPKYADVCAEYSTQRPNAPAERRPEAETPKCKCTTNHYKERRFKKDSFK